MHIFRGRKHGTAKQLCMSDVLTTSTTVAPGIRFIRAGFSTDHLSLESEDYVSSLVIRLLEAESVKAPEAIHSASRDPSIHL